MTFPNPDKGPFEDENGDWCRHVTNSFLNGVTMPILAAPGCDAAHAAVAHINGAIFCAMIEAARHGGTTVPPELLDKFRSAFASLENETNELYAQEGVKPKPFLTALPGGKDKK